MCVPHVGSREQIPAALALPLLGKAQLRQVDGAQWKCHDPVCPRPRKVPVPQVKKPAGGFVRAQFFHFRQLLSNIVIKPPDPLRGQRPDMPAVTARDGADVPFFMDKIGPIGHQP
jgi:hypothetical protein